MGALLERIDELLRTVGSAGDSWRNATARIENTLTEGYAHALALEGERWRLHRQIGEAAASLTPDDTDGAQEISTLARRLARALAVPGVNHARSGAVALDLRTGAMIFARKGSRPLSPASVEKLPVTY